MKHGTDRYRLAHFSDIHITSAPRDVPWRSLLSKRVVGWANLKFLGRHAELRDAARITKALVDDIAEIAPDHVLFTGDLTGLSLREEFEAAATVLAPLLDGDRATGIPGNHDVYTRRAVRAGYYQRLFGAWEVSDREPSPPIVRQLGDSLALVALVDARPAAWHDSSGAVGDDQLRRLEECLADPAIRTRRKVLALHYGPRRADGTPDTRLHGLRDADRVLEIAASGGVDLIVHGHLHRRFVLPCGDGTPVTIANPGSATYGAGDRAYHVIEIDDAGLRLIARRWDAATGRFAPWPDAPGAGQLTP